MAEDHPRAGAQVALRVAVADQIAHDEPPQVWRTAQRLLADGRDHAAVMRQLVLALTPSLMNVVVGGEEFDLDTYLAALERLPIPPGDECERAMLDIVSGRRSIEDDGLVAQRLGVRPTTRRSRYHCCAVRATRRALLAYVAELHRPLTRSRRISPERVSRPDLVADVGVLGDQVQSSAGR